MRQFLISAVIGVLILLAGFLVWGCTSAADAHPTWPDYTTDTLTTSDTLQPNWMIEWVVVLDDIQETQEAYRESILAQARILANPVSTDDECTTATKRLIRAQSNIETLDGLFYKIRQHDVLQLDPDARDYGVWVRNPLKE